MNKRATWIRPIDTKKLLKAVLTALEGESVVVLEGKVKSLVLPSELQCLVPAEFKSEAPGTDVVALRLLIGSALAVFHAITNPTTLLVQLLS
jgi:hypothetical protein